MHTTQGHAGVSVPELLVLASLAGVTWAAPRAWRRAGLRRAVVEGASMTPTLLPGDRLLMGRPDGLRAGDIVVLADPRDGTRTLVKRVVAVTGAGIDVRGDNPGASTDSRTFGPVAPATVLGRAVYRYAPPGRVGRLARWYRAWDRP